MAKATVTMTCAQCGTTYTATKICYNRREADAWTEWMSKQQGCCRECYAAAKAAERKAEIDEANQASATEAETLGWPVLSGTEKQVKWATTIRREAFVRATRHDPATIKADFRTMVASVLSEHTSAEWWIEHRGGEAAKAIYEAMKAAYDAKTRQENAK